MVQPVVEKLGCGRVRGRAENDPHSQGATIECLSTKIDEVNNFYFSFLGNIFIKYPSIVIACIFLSEIVLLFHRDKRKA
jgi:hypothetical protein